MTLLGERRRWRCCETTLWAAMALYLLSAGIAVAQTESPQRDKACTPAPTCETQANAPEQKQDPFENVAPAAEAQPAGQEPAQSQSWFSKFFSDNFAFKKEIMSEFDINDNENGASRQSIGFEVLKKFSTSTSTVASFDFQCRLVRRDGFNPVPNDMEGAGKRGWAFEYDNFYLDLYNVFNPLLSEDSRADSVGRFNFRIGRFYLPFGLNLQTDTHGTLLQLSNGDNFGFDQDWYTGFWGAINKHLNYDLYYVAGSGYDLKFKGQTGLGALRISLANKYSSEYGFEGGLSVIGGERLAAPFVEGHNNTIAPPVPLETERIGIDGRYRHTAPHGLLTFTTELSGGRDAANPVITQLGQAEYLHSSRRWGLGSQFRRFFEDTRGTNSALIGEFTWYFRNDVANSNAHWIKLNVERQLQSVTGPPHTIVTLQYYLYL
jgi:hypothetical protein